MKRLLLSGLLVLTLALNAQAPTAVPIPKEPHHHLVLENNYVRVFRVSVPGHDATLLHQHDGPYLYVSLGPADVINAIQGRPEVHIVMADGQVGYSLGNFAHIARTDTGLVFNNVTIELLKPQGEPKNICEKIVDGPLNDCPSSEARGLPPNSPLLALAGATRKKQLLKTDELLMSEESIALKMNYILSDPHVSQLLVVDQGTELGVDRPGELSQTLHGGEVLWIDPGKKVTIVTAGPHKNNQFLLIRFKQDDTTKQP